MEGKHVNRKNRRKKKRKPKISQQSSTRAEPCVGDNEFTVDHFANASSSKEALKKHSKKRASGSIASNFLPSIVESVDDDASWYDREDSDDDRSDDDLTTEEGSIQEDDLFEETTVINAGKSSLSEVCSLLEIDSTGKSYSLDIWCLLANYIKPEQVQTFAGICRGSYEAVCSVSFWIRLYKRFVTDTACLPDRLKEDWIESRAGLKARIVRSLFISYKNLRNQLSRETLEGSRNTHTVSQLVGLRCCFSWFKLTTSSAKESDTCTFYFKFSRGMPKIASQGSLFASDTEKDYLNWNNERDFIVLQVNVANFIPLQSICGLTLTDISVNLSRNMRYHCLKMVFHSFRSDGRYRKADGTPIVLDPVCEFRLLRWWYPNYPHNDE